MNENEREEIVTTEEEVTEVRVVEEEDNAESDKGLSVGLIGLAGIAIGVTGKVLFDKFAKPKIEKHKANRAAKKEAAIIEVIDADEDFEDQFDDEEN